MVTGVAVKHWIVSTDYPPITIKVFHRKLFSKFFTWRLTRARYGRKHDATIGQCTVYELVASIFRIRELTYIGAIYHVEFSLGSVVVPVLSTACQVLLTIRVLTHYQFIETVIIETKQADISSRSIRFVNESISCCKWQCKGDYPRKLHSSKESITS